LEVRKTTELRFASIKYHYHLRRPLIEINRCSIQRFLEGGVASGDIVPLPNLERNLTLQPIWTSCLQVSSSKEIPEYRLIQINENCSPAS
jgi:hypothetical protein